MRTTGYKLSLWRLSMKTRFSTVLSALLLSSLASLPACASLVGSSTTGSLTFTGDPSNYFDPGYGFVPAGYLNANSATVAVSGSAVEFGFDDGASLITADLGASGIVVSEGIELSGPANPFELSFTDAAFAGLSVNSTSGNLTPANLSLSGDTLTLDFAGMDVTAGQSFTTSVGLAPTPEPPTLVLTLTSVMVSFAVFAFRGLRPAA